MLFFRALEILETKLWPDDVGVACKLVDTGDFVRAAGRPVEAEALCRRALEIQEAKLGPRDPQVALTLLELGGGGAAEGSGSVL